MKHTIFILTLVKSILSYRNELNEFLQLRPDSKNYLVSAEYRLKHKLLIENGYERSIAPLDPNIGKIRLNFTMSPVQLLSLDIKEETFKIKAWLYHFWTDRFLTWNPKDYDNISSIPINVADIWTPDILLYNSVDEQFHSRFDTPAVLFSNGLVRWCAPAVMTASCKVFVKYFPFDTQSCKLDFGVWSTSDVDPWPLSYEIDKDWLAGSETWNFIKGSVERKQNVYYGNNWGPEWGPDLHLVNLQHPEEAMIC